MSCKENNRNGRLITISAPSGAGKSTMIRYLLAQDLNIQFSISATSRPPRGEEKDGVEYYFLTPEEFRERIAADEFLEYEEVYDGRFYGTLKSEVERILSQGKNVIFDVDCVGALNIKKVYGDRALTVFVMPPSVEVLRQRLEKRGTDAPEVIENRLAKAKYEMSFAPRFDAIVCNDDYERARVEMLKLVSDFVSINL
ncbi:MAG TPA: guanylate kinase [Bacteroidales bacterium]|nr:guanylate kinase [Bacteroidales bacterium]